MNPTVDGRNPAPHQFETMGKPLLAGIFGGITSFQGVLGGAKWISSIHSMTYALPVEWGTFQFWLATKWSRSLSQLTFPTRGSQAFGSDRVVPEKSGFSPPVPLNPPIWVPSLGKPGILGNQVPRNRFQIAPKDDHVWCSIPGPMRPLGGTQKPELRLGKEAPTSECSSTRPKSSSQQLGVRLVRVDIPIPVALLRRVTDFGRPQGRSHHFRHKNSSEGPANLPLGPQLRSRAGIP